MANKIVVDPITRIEGHLKAEVEVENGVIVEARCSGTMFRGLEQHICDKVERPQSPLFAWVAASFCLP